MPPQNTQYNPVVKVYGQQAGNPEWDTGRNTHPTEVQGPFL